MEVNKSICIAVTFSQPQYIFYLEFVWEYYLHTNLANLATKDISLDRLTWLVVFSSWLYWHMSWIIYCGMNLCLAVSCNFFFTKLSVVSYKVVYWPDLVERVHYHFCRDTGHGKNLETFIILQMLYFNTSYILWQA